MKTDSKLRKISSTLRCGSILLAVLLPLSVIYSWFMGPVAAAPVPHPVVQTPGIGSFQWFAGGLVAVISPVFLSVALFLVSRCFGNFSRGDYFSGENSKRLSGFGKWILLSGLAGLLAPTLIGLILTAHAGQGQRVFLIELGSGPLLSLLLGGLIWSFARILERATEISEENAQIV